MIFLYKIVNNIINCTSLLGLFKFNVPAVYTRHMCTFYPNSYNTNIGSNSLLNRAVNIFNDKFNNYIFFSTYRLSNMKFKDD